MKSSTRQEERMFKQGKLVFDAERGNFKDEVASVNLKALPAEQLPDNVSKAIDSFFK